MSWEAARIAKLNTSQQIPAPEMVPVPSFNAAWVAGATTTSTYYFRVTAVSKSANATPVWQGESLPSTETTLAGAASKDRARLTVTLDPDADGFKIYQRVTAGVVHRMAEIHVTRNNAGDITAAALYNVTDVGTVVGVTATTVTYDTPSGAAVEADTTHEVVPTVDTAQLDYLVLVDPLFYESGGNVRKMIEQELSDGSNAGNLLGHVVQLDLSVETTSTDGAADMRTLFSWQYVRLWMLPTTYPTVAWDGLLGAATLEQLMAAWDTGPRRWPIMFRGSKSYGTPAALLTS